MKLKDFLTDLNNAYARLAVRPRNRHSQAGPVEEPEISGNLVNQVWAEILGPVIAKDGPRAA